MLGPASTVLLTVTGLEALVLASRLPLRKGRVEHVRLLIMVITLAVDELAHSGLPQALAMVAVVTAQGNVLGPRHRLTRIQNLVALAAVVCLAALQAAFLPLWPAAFALLAVLQVFSAVQLLLERHWMGWPVFTALGLSGAVWLAGRVAEAVVPLDLPTPGLPLALSLIPAVPMWWFAPDGPHVSRWQSLAAGLEGRLESTEAMLRSQSRLEALGFVAAGAAHEYRSALSGIAALAGFAREGQSPTLKDQALEAIRSRALEAHGAVIPLLEQIGGGVREEVTVLDLSRDMAPLLSVMRATCRRDGIDMTFQADPSSVVRARKTEVAHILMNLLRNAVEASHVCPRTSPAIHVRVWAEGSSGITEVEDNAGGVPPERVGFLFSPQVSSPGSGVGLFIARGLAVRNGGDLVYEPIPGGSRFRLLLPREEPSKEPA